VEIESEEKIVLHVLSSNVSAIRIFAPETTTPRATMKGFTIHNSQGVMKENAQSLDVLIVLVAHHFRYTLLLLDEVALCSQKD
jgi:hypothetical protein